MNYPKFFARKAEFDLISREENLWIQQIKMFEESPNFEHEDIENLSINLRAIKGGLRQIEERFRELEKENSVEREKQTLEYVQWKIINNEKGDEFKSSASILLCDNNKKETSDDLKRLHYFTRKIKEFSKHENLMKIRYKN